MKTLFVGIGTGVITLLSLSLIALFSVWYFFSHSLNVEVCRERKDAEEPVNKARASAENVLTLGRE